MACTDGNRSFLQSEFLESERSVSNQDLNTSADSEKLYQRNARDESADVRRISHTAGSGRSKVSDDKLVRDPYSYRDEGRDRRQEVENKGPDLPLRKEQNIAAQHARYRARCAEHRD